MLIRPLGLAFVVVLASCSSSSSSNDAPGGDAGGDTDAASNAGDDAGSSKDDAGSPKDDASSPPPTNLTVTTITPDQALDPAYVGVLKNGNLILTEGKALRAVEMEPTGKVVHVNTTDFTGFEWPRSIAVDDAGQVYIAGYQAIHSFAKGPSDPHVTYVSATTEKQSFEWIAWGGTPKRLWALTGPNPVSPKMQFVRYDAATPTSGGAPTVVYEVDRFSVMSFAVNDANEIFTVDSNTCRIRKVSAGAVVTVIAGKPAAEQGVCNIGSAYGDDTDGHLTMPQAGSLGWDPTGTKLLLSGATKIVDVSERADGRSKGDLLHAFDETVGNESFAATKDALYVVDRTNHDVKKLAF